MSKPTLLVRSLRRRFSTSSRSRLGESCGPFAQLRDASIYSLPFSRFSSSFEVLFVLSTQLTGLTLAGLTRRFLVSSSLRGARGGLDVDGGLPFPAARVFFFQVDPASLIWPQVLIVSTILNTLHAEEEGTDPRMTRIKFFSIFFAVGFFWYFLPGFLFGALGYFSWVCWIKPGTSLLLIPPARLDLTLSSFGRVQTTSSSTSSSERRRAWE